jgi:hypothetical protein
MQLHRIGVVTTPPLSLCCLDYTIIYSSIYFITTFRGLNPGPPATVAGITKQRSCCVVFESPVPLPILRLAMEYEFLGCVYAVCHHKYHQVVVSNKLLTVGSNNQFEGLDGGNVGAPGGKQYHSLEINYT